MGRTTRAAAVLPAAAALFLLAGCAQPGQLGGPDAADAPQPTASAPAGGGAADDSRPEDPELPMLLGSGLVDRPVEIATPGPAVYSVRTVIIPPGVDVGWHLHPGTETAVVTAGAVTVRTEEECEPATYDAGQGLFVPDAMPHVMSNEGDVTAELVVSYLLAPGAPDQLTAEDECGDDGGRGTGADDEPGSEHDE